MNYTPDCGDCPTPTVCKEKDDCQIMRQLRHGHETRGGSGWDNVKHLPADMEPRTFRPHLKGRAAT